ncbi:hypothetical protein [Salinicoccus albus]|uniref:hypothetical protein n=1 Tax=Salinicoccus albus TaxID=418756 RepID=UPI000382CE5F|nr:hypothetical protein [Salinicoccus albus]
MKRLLTLILAVSLLAACGGEEPKQDVETETTAADVEAEPNTTEESTEESEVVHESDMSDNPLEETGEETREAVGSSSVSDVFGEDSERSEEYSEENVDEQPTALENETLGILEEAYGERGTVSFDEETKTYTILPTDPGLSVLVEYVSNGNYSEQWDDIVTALVGVSDSIYVSMGEGYKIEYKNPNSEAFTIIRVKDGELLYDFSDDL